MIDFKQFQKPQRYIGNEWNVIKKPHSGKITICISYPDLYEIGMSNLGLHIIYGLLNRYSDIVCERVFMPGKDMLNFLRRKKQNLFSLETKTPLKEFEILGFHLGCELNFTNLLHILDLGGIALFAQQRKDIIVIGGGIANPEPLAAFVDIFYLGEFEEVAAQFIEVLRKYKNKQWRLQALSEIEGFYVPAFYSVKVNSCGYQFQKKYPYAKFPLHRVYVKNLDTCFVPSRWLTPHTQIVHDRVPIELARGCPNHCTFCQARAIYFPYRERKISVILQIMRDIYKTSGYENFSLLALSASQYSQIEELIDVVGTYFKDKGIGLALPSLNISDIIGRLYSKLTLFKKTSLTVAIEAAESSLRNNLNKKIDTNILFEAAARIRSLGMRHLKIYFMFGFPQESDQDLMAIGQFLKKLSDESKLMLKVSINAFLPKPFSLWENVIMADQEVLERKRKLLLRYIPQSQKIKISVASIQQSVLEAIISRADRKFSSVIYRAFSKGAVFDGYSENFSWALWQESLSEVGIDYPSYLKKNYKNYPWSFIQIKKSKD